MNTRKIEQLLKRLARKEKHVEVQDAIVALLANPMDIDLQIDVLGQAHLSHWLPRQKRLFWDSFNASETQLMNRCLERLFASKGEDTIAICALLKYDAVEVLLEARRYVGSIVNVWDVQNGYSCNVMLGNIHDGSFTNCINIGWSPKDAERRIHRVDYFRAIDATAARKRNCLAGVYEQSNVEYWFWAERNGRYRLNLRVQHNFGYDLPYMFELFGHSKPVLEELNMELLPC